MSTETPENCPGPESEKAGYSDACATCPSRQTCQTTPKGPDPGTFNIYTSFMILLIYNLLLILMLNYNS